MRIALIIISFVFISCSSQRKAATPSTSPVTREVSKTLRKHIQEEAAWALTQEPVTVTAQTSPRSAGGKHDFFVGSPGTELEFAL